MEIVKTEYHIDESRKRIVCKICCNFLCDKINQVNHSTIWASSHCQPGDEWSEEIGKQTSLLKAKQKALIQENRLAKILIRNLEQDVESYQRLIEHHKVNIERNIEYEQELKKEFEKFL